MTTLETLPESSALTSVEKHQPGELFDLQLSVARRADALARRDRKAGRDDDRRAWLRAELEVFERVEQAERSRFVRTVCSVTGNRLHVTAR